MLTEQLEKKLRRDGKKQTDLPRRRLVWGWRDADAIPALLQYTEEIAQRQVEDSGLAGSEPAATRYNQVSRPMLIVPAELLRCMNLDARGMQRR